MLYWSQAAATPLVTPQSCTSPPPVSPALWARCPWVDPFTPWKALDSCAGDTGQRPAVCIGAQTLALGRRLYLWMLGDISTSPGLWALILSSWAVIRVTEQPPWSNLTGPRSQALISNMIHSKKFKLLTSPSSKSLSSLNRCLQSSKIEIPNQIVRIDHISQLGCCTHKPKTVDILDYFTYNGQGKVMVIVVLFNSRQNKQRNNKNFIRLHKYWKQIDQWNSHYFFVYFDDY